MSLTDEPTVNAITAVWHDDESTAERWFGLISSTFHDLVAENDGNAPNFDQFWPAFEGAAASDHGANVEAFRGYLDNVNDPMAVIADLAGDEPNAVLPELVTRYREGLTAAYAQQEETPAEAGAAADGEPYDDSYWAAYLQRWAGAWDGTDDAWTEFAEGFSYWAGEEPKFGAQLREQADALLAHAVTLEVAERVVYLSSFGVVAAPEVEDQGPDAQEIVGEEVRPEDAGQPEGIVDDPFADEEDELEGAPIAEQLAVTEAVTQTVDELLEQEVMPLLTATLNEVPEAADLTPEEINAVVERVLAEQLKEQLT